MYDAVGVYPMYLAVSNASGCSDTAWLDIIVNDYHTFFVPNAFTPNGNGTNDEFGPEFTNILSEGYDFFIFDRWGNMVFETTDISICWDGVYNGKKMNSAVFAYYLVATLNTGGDPVILKGNISLVR